MDLMANEGNSIKNAPLKKLESFYSRGAVFAVSNNSNLGID